ncbi:MAG: FAD-dependent oxidoreductase [Terriglobia bacterium]
MKAYLTASRELAPNTRHFEFESPEWSARFVAGQFLSLTRTIHDQEITRAYSIASPPGGNQFALCANLVDDGRFSPFLFGMHPGDEVDFKGPYGAFILRRAPADCIFVATGTGIAPFRSMLLDMSASQPERRISLIFGVRHEYGLLYHDEWLQLARDCPNFDYRPTLTRPGDAWIGRRGRVQAHVLAALQEDALQDRRNPDVYICGLREMVDDLRRLLKEEGLDRKRIIYEKYD